MGEFRFTFGQKYHREKHPCKYVHPDGYITVIAPNGQAARTWFIKIFGNRFCSVYTPEQMEELRLTDYQPIKYNYWPLGELHRYTLELTKQGNGIEMTESESKMVLYQLAVLYNDGTTMYYDAENGWKITSTSQTLVVGRGLKRHVIPLINVRSISFIDHTYKTAGY